MLALAAWQWNRRLWLLGSKVPVSEQLSPGGDGVVVPAEPISSEEPSGLVTVESDLQQADNVTGVVTATGNVRITYPVKQVQATARQAQYFTKEERIILIGDVEVTQEGGNRLNAERVTYLVLEDRLIADPATSDQVFSKFKHSTNGTFGGFPMSLQLQSVHLSLGGRPVVQGVTIELQPGEVVGLLGPNGAGKTTTFNLVTGMLQPDQGDVMLDGVSISGLTMPERSRQGIGYLPQEPSVFRNLSVRDNLLLAMQESGFPAHLRRERLDELIEDFQLDRFLYRKGFQLSGGERRRTEVARALAVGANGPRYLLLDEPFAGVDPLAVSDLQKLIGYPRDRGVGMFITDHNVRETLSITNHAYILTDGRILAAGTAAELAADAQVKRSYLGEDFRL